MCSVDDVFAEINKEGLSLIDVAKTMSIGFIFICVYFDLYTQSSL